MKILTQTITLNEAYDIMVNYLEKYYNRTQSDDIGSLLSGLQLLSDNESADPAALQDWHDSVNKILNKKNRIRPYLKLFK